MRELNFLEKNHIKAKRNYLARMNHGKPDCMRIAKRYGAEFWDGDRKYGYGGYTYDGRWASVAKSMAEYYGIKERTKILDIGCGKAHLLYEFAKLKTLVDGLDISKYALENAILKNLGHGTCTSLPYQDNIFDFSYSILTFHNLGYSDLKKAIKEMVRVTSANGKSYICVESYRTEEELMNLQCWALTALSFYSPEDWKSILQENGYTGDVEFLFFN